MKKGLIATTLAGTVLATGIFTGQAHAAEQININNAKDIADKATLNDEAMKNSFSPASSSVIGGNDKYTTVKKGNDYIISSPDKGAYTYRLTSDGKLYATTKYDGKEYYISQADVESNSQQPAQVNENQTNANHQSSTSDMPSNTSQQQMQSNEASVLPETGVQQTGITTIIAAILGVAGSILLFSNRKHQS